MNSDSVSTESKIYVCDLKPWVLISKQIFLMSRVCRYYSQSGLCSVQHAT